MDENSEWLINSLNIYSLYPPEIDHYLQLSNKAGLDSANYHEVSNI